jgi:hypothetical protein
MTLDQYVDSYDISTFIQMFKQESAILLRFTILTNQ